MSRIKTAISGITTRPDHPDGECRTLVNLRPSNGAYKPVPPRKITRALTGDYSIYFVHRGANYEKWLGITGDRVYDITVNETLLFTIPPLYRYDGVPSGVQTVNSVQQIGNTLSFVTGSRVYYALYKDGAYNFLGEIPELPVVDFSTPVMTTASRNYQVEYPGGVTSGSLVDATKGLVGILIDANRNRFHDAFLIRYAFRLHDGSVIKHSSPMLVMPREHFDKWGTAILPTSIPADSEQIATNSSSSVTIKQFVLQASYDFSILAAWKDVIRSVDFFVSKYVGLAGPENVVSNFWVRRVDGICNLYKSFGRSPGYYVAPSASGTGTTGAGESRSGRSSGSRRTSSANMPSGNESTSEGNIEFITPPSEAKEKDRVMGVSGNFYLYYSDEDFEAKNINFPNGEVTATMDSIIYQKEMPGDNLSHHNTGARISSVYNNRLRLSNITTSPFDGFLLRSYQWRSAYNGVQLNSGTDVGRVWVNIKINSPDGVKTVQRSIESAKIFYNPFVSYPDPRAFKMEVFQFTYNSNPPPSYLYKKILSIDLKPHPYLNIAYSLNDDLEPWLYDETGTSPSTPEIISRPSWTEKNKIKVSEVDNPFAFLAQNTYQVGIGEILAESSIIMNVSDRNYGLYPVFVFTTDGVFPMAGQTPDLVHESIQAPTYLEPPISNVICPTPYGVVFVTKRGLMVINQHGTEFISQTLREDGDSIDIDLSQSTSPLSQYPLSIMREFISNARQMIYNPYNDELIISSGTGYSLVYDFPTKSFYLSTVLVGGRVQNTFPDTYLVSDKKVKDVSQADGQASEIAIITRPLKFGTYDVKKLHRVVLRAIMHNATDAQVMLYHSIDGVSFYPAKGYNFGSSKNYKDLDLGLLARQTYRQYIFLLTGTFDEETEIRLLEFEIEKNYNNEKLR